LELLRSFFTLWLVDALLLFFGLNALRLSLLVSYPSTKLYSPLEFPHEVLDMGLLYLLLVPIGCGLGQVLRGSLVEQYSSNLLRETGDVALAVLSEFAGPLDKPV